MEVEIGGGEHQGMHLPSGQARTIGLFRLSIPATRIVAISFISLGSAIRQKLLYSYGHGSSQLGRWKGPSEGFLDWAISFSSHKEQASIATFLDHETAKIDALIAEQESLIELLQEKHQAVIFHAVT
jgi:type I restriction enzyme S subunit